MCPGRNVAIAASTLGRRNRKTFCHVATPVGSDGQLGARRVCLLLCEGGRTSGQDDSS